MFFSRVFTIAAALLPLSAVASPTSQPDNRNPRNPSSLCPSVYNPDPYTLLNNFKAFNTQLFSGDAAGAFAKYVSPSITEHSTSGGGYNGDVAFLGALMPTVNIAVIAGLQQCNGNICWVHYKATPKSGGSPFINNVTAISDFYRYEGSCIVEHWDSVETASASTTNPLFPGN
jgi:predicted SnoaL-like aldol condensation-catalyzing enzyme